MPGVGLRGEGPTKPFKVVCWSSNQRARETKWYPTEVGENPLGGDCYASAPAAAKREQEKKNSTSGGGQNGMVDDKDLWSANSKSGRPALAPGSVMVTKLGHEEPNRSKQKKPGTMLDCWSQKQIPFLPFFSGGQQQRVEVSKQKKTQNWSVNPRKNNKQKKKWLASTM